MGSQHTAALLLGFGLLTLPAIPGARASDQQAPDQAGFDLPALPEVTVSMPPAEAPVVAQPAAPEITPPDLPAAEVTIGVAGRLGGTLAARLADDTFRIHPRLARKERDAIAAFYALGNFEPIWVKDGAWTAPARSLIARLGAAHEDALDSSDYPVPTIGVTAADSASDLAVAELNLSA